MSIRDILDLERINTLDVLLPQRWARRLSTRIAKWERRFTGLYGRGGSYTDGPGISAWPTVLGGLEVMVDGGAIFVSPGALLQYPLSISTAGAFAPRPASYTFQDPVPGTSPPDPEGDDDNTILYDNAHVKPVPFTFGPALAVSEWWIVYATRTTTTTETDTARVTINEITGALVAAAQPKVRKQLLTFGIARGPSSAGFPALPGSAIPLGAIFVPSLSTNLSFSNTFDLRRMRHASREPNQIGGCWDVDSAGVDAWRGHVWAHHRGEVLEARAMGGVAIADLCSPGATWDATATPTTPKIAWLYLARAANGTVPRIKQYASGELTTNATTNHKFYQAGVLVLSPVRPRLGLGPDKNETAGRWDMQSSAPIALPSYFDSNPPRMQYDFSGQVAATGDAICVGMIVYDGITGGVPNVRSMSVTADGWARGEGISLRTRGDLASSPIAFATLSVVGTDVTFGARRSLIGDYSVPIDGVFGVHSGAYAQAAILWRGGSVTGNDGASLVYATDRFSAALPHVLPGGSNDIRVAQGSKSGSGSMPSDPTGVWLEGVRLPYSVPLFT